MTPDKSILAWSQNSLDQACRDNPALTLQWGIEYAKARKKASEQENALKAYAADLGQRIRKDPLSFGLAKITEDGIEEAIRSDTGYKAEQQALVDAEYEKDILKAMIDALADRKEQLSNDVKLYGQQYWSKPDTSGSVPTDGQRIQAMANLDVGTRPVALPTSKGVAQAAKASIKKGVPPRG